MVTAAIDAAGFETGGILVGALVDGQLCAAFALEIPSAKPSRATYYVPAGVTRRLVDCVRRVDPRLGYIGEWHVHPADAPASSADAETMGRLANHVVADGIKPVLVVVKQVADSTYSMDILQWERRGQRRLKVLRIGDLPVYEP